MKYIDILKLSVSNILRRKLRCALTISGVVIGCVCIMLMVSFGVSGFENYKKTMFEGSSFTQITVSGSADSGANSVQSATGAKVLNDSAVEMFRGISNVISVSPVLSIPCTISLDNKTTTVQLSAVDFDAYGFDKSGVNGKNPIVFCSSSLLAFYDYSYDDYISELFKSEDYLDFVQSTKGRQIKLALGYGDRGAIMYGNVNATEYESSLNYYFTVSDVIDEMGMAFIDIDDAKSIIKDNSKLANQLNLQFNNYSTVNIKADNTRNVIDILEKITKLGYSAYSPVQDLESISDEFFRQQLQLIVIAFVSLFVSAIGISNSMLSGVSERKSEIGVMKVVGMSSSKIRAMFMTEALLLGLGGGIFGVVLSYISVAVINGSSQGVLTEILNSQMIVSTEIPLWLSVAVVIVAGVVGVLSGIYPAVKATKMSPMEAIRNE